MFWMLAVKTLEDIVTRQTQAQRGSQVQSRNVYCWRCQLWLRIASKSPFNEQIQWIFKDCPWTFSHKNLGDKRNKSLNLILTGLWLLLFELSVSGSGQVLMQILGSDLIFRGSHLTNIIPVLHRSLLRRGEYRHKPLTWHKLMRTERRESFNCTFVSSGLLCAATLHSGLSNESNHSVLIWNEAPCVMIHFNLETIYTPWQKFPLNFIFCIIFYLCLVAINNKKYIKTSIKIIYVSDYFYCQKSKNLLCQLHFCSPEFHLFGVKCAL